MIIVHENGKKYSEWERTHLSCLNTTPTHLPFSLYYKLLLLKQVLSYRFLQPSNNRDQNTCRMYGLES